MKHLAKLPSRFRVQFRVWPAVWQDLSLLPVECCPAFFEMPWTSWHPGVWQQSSPPCLSGELAHLSPRNQPPALPPLRHPWLTHCSRNNLKEIASGLGSWEVRGSSSLGCSAFLVPPLFFLNFVLLLVFLLCGIFLVLSSFQRGGALGLQRGSGRWGELPPSTWRATFEG